MGVPLQAGEAHFRFSGVLAADEFARTAHIDLEENHLGGGGGQRNSRGRLAVSKITSSGRFLPCSRKRALVSRFLRPPGTSPPPYRWPLKVFRLENARAVVRKLARSAGP